MPGACRGQKIALDALELKLQTVVDELPLPYVCWE